MKLVKAAILAIAAVCVLGLGLYAAARGGLFQTRYDQVKAVYAAPPSRFVSIDGVPVHVRDEGAGPVIVMLHGSILNLHEWDPVAERLKTRYRVVRLDWPPYGLSGPDPSGVYSTARAAQLLSDLADQMRLQPFVLVATSNGVNVGMQYLVEHPGHARAFAISIPPVERPSQTRKGGALITWLAKWHAQWLPDYHPAFFYRLIFEDTGAPGFRPPARMVDMAYQTNNLPGAAARQRAYIASNTKLFKTTDVGGAAAKIAIPVLIQWCDLDTVISQSPQGTVARFKQAPVSLIRYRDIGHFPMWEDPQRFTRDLEAFIDRLPAS